MDWLNAQREEEIGFADRHSLVAKTASGFFTPCLCSGNGGSVTMVRTRAIETTNQNKKTMRRMRVTLVFVINVIHPIGQGRLIGYTSEFPYSRSCLRPPHKHCADGAEDRYRRPENPPKGLLAWSVLLITEAYGQRLLLIGHGNPYAFKLLQFGEIGLKFFGHLLGWESNTNAKLCGAVSQLARFSPERRPVQAHKE